MGVAADGRVYWGSCNWDNCSNKFWTWQPATGLTTVLPTNRIAPGRRSTAVSDNGWAFFGVNEASTANYYAYHPTQGGLFTLVGDVTRPGFRSTGATADGRVYFGEDANPGRYWTWHKDTGLTTILTGVPKPGFDSTKVAPDGRIYFGSYSSTGRFWTWHPSTGLTTILSSANHPGIGSEEDTTLFLIDPVAAGVGVGPDSRVFIGESANSGRFWTWHPSTGLTIIVSGIAVPGKGTTQVDPNGRVYFGTGGHVTSSGRYLTWHPNTGLSTIVANIAEPGYHYTSSVIPNAEGGIFFNQGVDPSTYYRWVPTPPSIALRRLALNGSPTNQDILIQVDGSPNYVAQTQSGDKDLYLVEGTAKTLDHYVPQRNETGQIVYRRTSRLNWGTWAATVKGVAVDDTSTKIALLDSGNKQLDVYANRYADGVPSPAPTSFSIAGQAANPTGLAFSNRTGRYLVVDSTVSGGKINIHLYNEAGGFVQSVPVDVTAANLGFDATGETNFKILLDERNNLLYLLSPALNRAFVMALPIYI
jgi:hypothetical protein